MKWLALASLAVFLVGCPRPVNRDAGLMDAGGVDAGMLDRDAGELPSNEFMGPLEFNDDALALVDPSTLSAGSSPCREPVLARVEYVVDGDTFRAAGQNTAFNNLVRLTGVDTPEVAHDGMPEECYGPEAEAFTEQLEGRLVWLTFDNECLDSFGRSLAYVHIAPDEQGFWERQLLRRGFARVLTIGGNRRFRSTFEDDADYARSIDAGLWGECP